MKFIKKKFLYNVPLLLSYFCSRFTHLCNNTQTRVNNRRFVNIEQEVWIFNKINPESKW